jgi:hypothetical protein
MNYVSAYRNQDDAESGPQRIRHTHGQGANGLGQEEERGAIARGQRVKRGMRYRAVQYRQ